MFELPARADGPLVALGSARAWRLHRAHTEAEELRCQCSHQAEPLRVNFEPSRHCARASMQMSVAIAHASRIEVLGERSAMLRAAHGVHESDGSQKHASASARKFSLTCKPLACVAELSPAVAAASLCSRENACKCAWSAVRVDSPPVAKKTSQHRQSPVTWETVIRWFAFALICFYWSLSARAQAPAAVSSHSADQALLESALRAFEQHDYPLALALFKRASVSTPSVTVRLFLARSHVALGQLVDAAADYRSVAKGAEAVETSASERRAIAEARDELAQLRPRIPSLEIALGEAEQRSRNLRVTLDGRLVPVSAPLAVDPGHHELVASDREGEQSRLGFEIAEGETKTMGLAWRSANHGSKKSEQLVGGSSARRTWGVVALTVGATGLGIGTVTGIAASTRYSRAEAHCPANRCTEGPPYPEDNSAFRTLRTISTAGFIVGGAGIGTWLGLLVTTPKASTEHPKVSPWTPVVGMGSAGARYVF